MANTKEDKEAMQPLLDWLSRLGTVTDDKKTIYENQRPHKFFEELRNGYILSKIAMVAVPHGASQYRMDVSPYAMTR